MTIGAGSEKEEVLGSWYVEVKGERELGEEEEDVDGCVE